MGGAAPKPRSCSNLLSEGSRKVTKWKYKLSESGRTSQMTPKQYELLKQFRADQQLYKNVLSCALYLRDTGPTVDALVELVADWERLKTNEVLSGRRGEIIDRRITSIVPREDK